MLVAEIPDSGLLAKAVGQITRTVKRIKADGGATRIRSQHGRRAAGRRPRDCRDAEASLCPAA
jgi:IS5 family transposase